MNSKQKIIELLNKESNQDMANLILNNIDKMNEEKLNDLYFLLTNKNKNEIFKFIWNKSEDLNKYFSELNEIFLQLNNITIEYKEKQDKKSDNISTNNLINNL